MQDSLTVTFKGSLCPLVSQDKSETRMFSPSTAPKVKGATERLEKAPTAMQERSPLLKEVDAFVKSTSVGKKKFGHSKHFLDEKDGVKAIVSCWWDEDDPPITVAPEPAKKTDLFDQGVAKALAAETPAPVTAKKEVVTTVIPIRGSNVPKVKPPELELLPTGKNFSPAISG